MPRIVTDFDGSLKIHGYITVDKCEGYLNELLQAFDTTGTYAINGWIEDERGSYRANCQNIAQDLLNRGSVGMTKYLDCAKIFFMHRDQIPSQWSQRFVFKTRKVHFSSPFPRLAFILIYQPAKSSIDASMIDKIIPDIITPQDSGYSDSQYQNKQRDFRGNTYSNPIGGRNDRYVNVRQPVVNVRQPVVNIKPEFMNMDSNENSNYFTNYEGSQSLGRGQSFTPQNVQNDPYSEDYRGQSFYQNRQQRERSGSNIQRKPFNDNRRGTPDQASQRSGNFTPTSQQNYARNPRNDFGAGRRPSQQREEVQLETGSQRSTQRQDESLEPGEISHADANKGFSRNWQPRQQTSAGNNISNPLYQEYLKNRNAGNQNRVAPASSVIHKYLKPNKGSTAPGKLSKGITKPSDTNNLLLDDDRNYEQKPQQGLRFQGSSQFQKGGF